MSFRLSHTPLRVTTGAYILNSGLSKWSADEATAEGMHAMAAGTYPVLKKVEPPLFVKALSVAEIGLGAALLAPFVSSSKAGAGLTAFSAGLLGLYVKTPGMQEGLRPTQAGIALAKDVWLFGIGSSLLIDGRARRRQAKRERKAAAALEAAEAAAEAAAE